jgi:hypothetical protein
MLYIKEHNLMLDILISLLEQYKLFNFHHFDVKYRPILDVEAAVRL